MKFSTAGLITFIIFNFSLSAQVTLINPNGGEVWHSGKQPKIIWKSQGVDSLNVSLSIDSGLTWTVVKSGLSASLPFYKWTIPSSNSHSALLKITSASDSTIFDTSDSLFTIKPDNGQVIKFVVLGSSTAAGTGPTKVDSAWVWKYREYLFQKNTATQVLNLAVGGYTTYHIMPDEFSAPSGRPARVIGKNITSALQALPDAIIINMPSNDAANNYPSAEQVSNYKVIASKAKEAKVPVWVATPQPRNFSQSQINIQLEMIDSTYALFGGHTIDFWTEIAYYDNRINSIYNTGDGVHLNNAGHRILFSRVVGKKILEQLDAVTSIEEKTLPPMNFILAQNYPNPFNPETKINYQLSEPGFVTLKIFDMLGREVANLLSESKEAGSYQAAFNTQHAANNRQLASGVYFYQLRVGKAFQTKKMVLLR